jgi:DNA sulfur modification protein DndB
MPTLFPAVRGQQRNQDFFQTMMDYGEIADLVKLPEDVLGDQLFNKELTMQREINWGRVKKAMVPYLENDDAFYSALTLVMVPRDFERMEEGEGYEFTPVDDKSPVGQLLVTSAVYLFPADGQHRVASIREFLKIHPEVAMEKVPVVLVPYRSRPATRQLFSDLNLNAKPPSKTIGLSFETREPEVLLAQEMERRVPLFNGRVNHFTNSLPATSANVITMNALYEANSALLEALGDDLDDLSGKKAGDPDFDAAAEGARQAWEAILSALPVWQHVLDGSFKPGDVRREYIIGYGVGWQAVAKAAAALIEQHPQRWPEKIAEVFSNVDWSQTNPDWQNVCMLGTRVNNTRPAVRATAGYILARGGVARDDNPFYGNWQNSLPEEERVAPTA